jgi:cyclin-dependent kinase 9
VYKGQCKKTKKSVALKKILVNEKDGGFPTASINEISILQNLAHENIVQLLGMCYSPSMFD